MKFRLSVQKSEWEPYKPTDSIMISQDYACKRQSHLKKTNCNQESVLVIYEQVCSRYLLPHSLQWLKAPVLSPVRNKHRCYYNILKENDYSNFFCIEFYSLYNPDT
jgi:hypothetical protein